MSEAKKTDGPIALVTGGSRGLGRSMVEHLAARGFRVAFTYRVGRAEAEQVLAAVKSAGGSALALQLDVGDAKSFERFSQELASATREAWGKDTLFALVHNAGAGAHALVAETTEAQLDELFGAHFKGPFLLTQRLLPRLEAGGHVVHVSSGLTRFTFPGYGAYAAMKGAVEVLTRYLARELGAKGIHVNTLAPGAIATDFGGGAVRDNPQLQAMLASQTALGRVGQPDDIGGALASLLAPESRWITGQRLEVSGGMFL